jgi:hypothetical protein
MPLISSNCWVIISGKFLAVKSVKFHVIPHPLIPSPSTERGDECVGATPPSLRMERGDECAGANSPSLRAEGDECAGANSPSLRAEREPEGEVKIAVNKIL